MISRFFIDRPVLANVLALFFVVDRPGLARQPADLAISERRPADRAGDDALSRRERHRRSSTPSPCRSSRTSTASRTCSTCSRRARATAPTISPSLSRSARTPTRTRSWCRTGSRRRSRPCPPEVQLQGVTTKKQSTSILEFVGLVSPDSRFDSLFLSNYAVINVVERTRAPQRASATCRCSAPANTPCASGWTRTSCRRVG